MQTFANMTLDDLKTGMIVTTRNGNEYLIIRSNDLSIVNTGIGGFAYNGYTDFHTYRDNMTCKLSRDFDVVKVEQFNSAFCLINFKNHPDKRKLIWKEQNAVKLTVAEIEARLGYKVEIVSEEE